MVSTPENTPERLRLALNKWRQRAVRLTLVVPIEKTSQTCEASDAKDSGISDQRCWARSTLEHLATLESDLVEPS
jgi:hypothetical protein